MRERRSEAGVPLDLLEAPISVIVERTGSRIERDVIGQFQGQVDTGELTVEQATTQAEKEFRKQFETETSGLRGLDASDLRVRSGERISQTVSSLAPAVGITALSFVPGGQIPAATLSLAVGGFFATRGSERIRSGDTIGGALDIGSGALFAVGGLGALGGAAGRLEQQILSSRLSRLESKPFRFGGRELFRSQDDVLLGVVGRRSIGDFGFQEARGVVPVFRTGTTPSGLPKFSIGGGRVQTATSIEGLPVRVGGSALEFQIPTFKDISKATFTARGTSGLPSSFGTPEFTLKLPRDQFIGSIGRLDVVRGDRVFTSTFQSIAQPKRDIIKIIGGTARTVRGRRLIPGFVSQPDIKVISDISSGGIVQRFGTRIKPGVDSFSIIGSGKTSDIIGGRLLQRSIREQGSTFGTVAGRETIIQTPKIQFSTGGRSSFIAPPVTTQRETLKISTQQPVLSFKQPKLRDITSQVIGLDIGQRQRTGSITSSLQASRSISKNIVSSDTLQRQLSQIGSQSIQTTKSISGQLSPITPTPGFGIGFGAPIGGFGFAGIGALPGFIFPTFLSGRVSAKGGKRKPGRIAPSLTGIALADLGDIFGGELPTSGLPITRLVPRRKKKKAKKK